MADRADESQRQTFRSLIRAGAHTSFGAEHGFADIRDESDFQKRVPVRDYEGLRPHIDRILAGEKDVLWPGRPSYLALTSGTTSGTKYIPLTRESLPSHFGTTRKALLSYYARTGNGAWLGGKRVVLSSAPTLQTIGDTPAGYLSSVIYHHVPRWFRASTLPGETVARMGDWEDKMAALVAESVGQDIRLVGGIPSWMQMFFEYLLAETGKATVRDVFPNLGVYVHGGVDYALYRDVLERQMGGAIDTVEVYPATEAFIAFQTGEEGEGMTLNLDAGIYFEFVPLENAGDPEAERLPLAGVETGRDYMIVISVNNGFWAYALGDTVRFVSTWPHRIVFSGRTRNFIAVAAERLIGAEVEQAIRFAAAATGTRVTEFTVAPQTDPPDGGRSYHEWFVEFDGTVPDPAAFEDALDGEIARQNYNYGYFRGNSLLGRPLLTPLQPGAFRSWMKSRGKLGGQFKVPRLQNNRDIATALEPMRLPPG